MKSLFIVNDFPPVIGGQSSYYHDLCQAFPSDSLVILAPAMKDSQAVDASLSCRIYRRRYLIAIPIVSKIAKIVLPLIYCGLIIRTHQIQCLHCAHVLSTGIVGLLIKKMRGLPYVVYTHSADILEYQKFPLLKAVLKSVLFNARRVVCNSRFTQGHLQRLGVRQEHIQLIYPKTDPERFSHPVSPWAGLSFYQNKKIILSVNRLVERKGNDVVIQAMPQVIQRVPNAVYLIGGAGPYQATLAQCVSKLHLEDRVVFLGSIPREQLTALYHACDVFVMASRNINDEDTEGFGIAFLEAGACAKPVIGGRSGGIPEAVVDGKTGFLVDPLNIQDIAGRIIEVLTQPSLAQSLAQAGRQRVVREFDRRGLYAEVKTLLNSL